MKGKRRGKEIVKERELGDEDENENDKEDEEEGEEARVITVPIHHCRMRGSKIHDIPQTA